MSSSRLRRPPGVLALVFGLVVATAGSIGLATSAQDRTDEVERIQADPAIQAAANDSPAENFLIVGSDSRADLDADADNADQLGVDEGVTGNRADTIMILRRERNGGAYLMSIPRDLWVDISGTDEEGKINGAFNGGPGRLAATITKELDIPINHYVEVDFAGFISLVDAIGGVEICFERSARDTGSGLVGTPGCHSLSGNEALAYTRSRHYEEFIDGDWEEVPPFNDMGRIARQQHFIQQAVTQLLLEVEANPFRINDLISAAASAIRVDDGANVVESANALRAAADAGLTTFSLPVEFIQVGDQSAVALEEDAEPILDFFRGVGPVPTPEPTATTDGDDDDG
jgi:LCP family protein required for cell wall assembly